MTKAQIFKTAHKIAKNLTGDYQVRIKIALKEVYAMIKKTVSKDVAKFLNNNKINGHSTSSLIFVMKREGTSLTTVEGEFRNNENTEKCRVIDAKVWAKNNKIRIYFTEKFEGLELGNYFWEIA